MPSAYRVAARKISARKVEASSAATKQRRVYRIADVGDSTVSLGHGTAWSSTPFLGRSDEPGHAADDVGELKIYSGGTATWKAAGDTVGASYSVGTGLIFMESGTAGKGFGFVITADDVAAADVGGTVHSITILPGSAAGVIGYQAATMFMWAQVLSGFQLEITGIHGVPGQTTEQVLAIIENVKSMDSHGKPIATKPDGIHISCAINDASALAAGGASFTITDTLNNLTAIKNWCLDNLIFCIFSSVSHGAPSTRRTYMDQINAHCAAMAAANPTMVYFADYTTVIDDPEDPDNAAYPSYMTGPHMTPRTGALVAASVLVDILDGIAGARQGRSTYRGDKPSLVPGAEYEGTITVGPAATCTGETEWDVFVGALGDDGDATVTITSESDSNERHNWQVFTCEGGALDTTIAITKPLESLPDHVVAEIEIEIDDTAMLGGSFIPGPHLGVIFYDEFAVQIGAIAGTLMPCGEHSQAISTRLKTDVITKPAGAVTARLVVYWAQLAGNDVVVKLINHGAEEVIVGA